MKKITIGSMNPEELEAVKATCEILEMGEVTIEGTQTSPGHFAQPLSLKEAQTEAFNRAAAARKIHNIAIGIASGIISLNDDMIAERTVVVVISPNGQTITSISPAVEFPMLYAQEAQRQGTTTSAVIDQIFSCPTNPTEGSFFSRKQTIIDTLKLALSQL